MTVTHYLVQEGGMCADDVERQTGMHAIDTSLGVLVEKPKPFNTERAMAIINRALRPEPRCTCSMFAVIHHPSCPAWSAIS